ncbi:MAG TPA: radical SAM protein [Candidatus Methylomirabilis sp.]|jgi:putative pyruvate formate lyase activating enzyme|nr:radical SAM protein [Candidatus Methylomirabilis sp.]
MLPSYLPLSESGELARRAERLSAMLGACDICPKDCRVNRLRGEVGFCWSGADAVVSAVVPHFGEEPCLTGTGGAGNIFFGNCNMRCVYCQNWQISQDWKGQRRNTVPVEGLAKAMLALQERGCHNINLVSPTHFVPQIVAALALAAPRGLRLPLVYNTNAYDSVAVLRLLDGIVDIYLPDLKYSDNAAAKEYSVAGNYAEASRTALKEMYRQMGPDLLLDEAGLARRGLIIRHLILPNDIAGSRECLRFVAEELSPAVHLSIMAQYYPTNKAGRKDLISRKIRAREYAEVLEMLEEFGFENGWTQEFAATDIGRPDFASAAPFAWEGGSAPVTLTLPRGASPTP